MHSRLIWPLIIISIFSLSACGKKGAPVAPGGNDDRLYPGQYPTSDQEDE